MSLACKWMQFAKNPFPANPRLTFSYPIRLISVLFAERTHNNHFGTEIISYNCYQLINADGVRRPNLKHILYWLCAHEMAFLHPRPLPAAKLLSLNIRIIIFAKHLDCKTNEKKTVQYEW